MQREIRRIYGIPERTLRRWKNDPTARPRDPQRVAKVARAGARAIRSIDEQQSRYAGSPDEGALFSERKPIVDYGVEILDHYKHLAPASRRKLRYQMIGYKASRGAKGRSKKRQREVWTYRLSDYVQYETRHLNATEQTEFAFELLRAGQSVRFLTRGVYYGGATTYYTTSMLTPETLRKYDTLEKFSQLLKRSSGEGFRGSSTGKAHQIITDVAAVGKRYH